MTKNVLFLYQTKQKIEDVNFYMNVIRKGYPDNDVNFEFTKPSEVNVLGETKCTDQNNDFNVLDASTQLFIKEKMGFYHEILLFICSVDVLSDMPSIWGLYQLLKTGGNLQIIEKNSKQMVNLKSYHVLNCLFTFNSKLQKFTRKDKVCDIYFEHWRKYLDKKSSEEKKNNIGDFIPMKVRLEYAIRYLNSRDYDNLRTIEGIMKKIDTKELKNYKIAIENISKKQPNVIIPDGMNDKMFSIISILTSQSMYSEQLVSRMKTKHSQMLEILND